MPRVGIHYHQLKESTAYQLLAISADRTCHIMQETAPTDLENVTLFNGSLESPCPPCWFLNHHGIQDCAYEDCTPVPVGRDRRDKIDCGQNRIRSLLGAERRLL